jgi:hypothetical protein
MSSLNSFFIKWTNELKESNSFYKAKSGRSKFIKEMEDEIRNNDDKPSDFTGS